METLTKFWKDFLIKYNLPESTPYAGEYCFGVDDEDSNNLLTLVLSKQKTAVFTALESFKLDNEPIPHKDFYYILVDSNDNPLGILKTINVQILAFKDITWSMALKEGEDDSMESWVHRKQDFFEEDSDIMGYPFTPDTPIVFEEFCLEYKA